jgi:hypothetical protein
MKKGRNIRSVFLYYTHKEGKKEDFKVKLLESEMLHACLLYAIFGLQVRSSKNLIKKGR